MNDTQFVFLKTVDFMDFFFLRVLSVFLLIMLRHDYEEIRK